jgi:hypothetical protein
MKLYALADYRLNDFGEVIEFYASLRMLTPRSGTC